MKSILTHLKAIIVMVLLLSSASSYAAEQEPNDNQANANLLLLNSSDGGTLDNSDIIDWWKIEVVEDGRLLINLSHPETNCVELILFDQDGTTELDNNGWCGYTNLRDSIYYNNLTPGFYYIQCTKMDNEDFLGPYNLSSVFTPCEFDNEANSDNEVADDAVVLALNDTLSGHLGYYGNGGTDTADWYTITTAEDGELVVKLIPDGLESCTQIYLYDTDQTTLIADNGWCGYTNYKDSAIFHNLAAGTYYIKAECPAPNIYYGSYKILNYFTGLQYANDAEENDSKETAVTVAEDNIITGHLGYYGMNSTDTYDWYKINTSSDGRLSCKVSSAEALCTELALYNSDGQTVITDNGSCGYTSYKDSLFFNLVQGTYYLRARSSGSYYGSYSITNSFEAVSFGDDVEPNDYAYQANEMAINQVANGVASSTDQVDWWKVNVTEDGQLIVRLTYDVDVCMNLILYASDSVTELTNNGACGYSNHVDSMFVDNLLPGTYYIKATTSFSGINGGYTLEPIVIAATYGNDIEVNDSIFYALDLGQNDTTVGHLGYFDGEYTDEDDWYKITTTNDGQLVVKAAVAEDLCIGMILYEDDGVTEVTNNGSCGYSNHKDSLFANIDQGIYYLKVASSSPGYFGSYQVSTYLVEPPFTNDVEPNDVKDLATRIYENTVITGHIGYSSYGTIDSYDWYKFTLSDDGALSINNGIQQDTMFRYYAHLYDSDTVSILTSDILGQQNSDALTYVKLKAGEYFLRVAQYSSYYGGYQLAIELDAPQFSRDVEDNDELVDATSIAPGETKDGHLGYYGDGSYDDYDWYAVTLPNDGDLIFSIATDEDSTLCMTFDLYDSDSTYYLDGGSCAPDNDTIMHSHLKAGTYFLRTSTYSSYHGSYQLTATHTATMYDNDVEPNDVDTLAQAIVFNDSITGHLGFYGNGDYDDYDWYSFTVTSENTEVLLRIVQNETNCINMALYSWNGTSKTYITDNGSCYGAISDTILKSDYAAGEYLLSLKSYSGSDYYGPYILIAEHSMPVNMDNASVGVDNIYPNPASKEVTLQFKDARADKHITIYDIQGKAVKKVFVSEFINKTTLDISDIEMGIYLIEIEQNNQRSIHRFIIGK